MAYATLLLLGMVLKGSREQAVEPESHGEPEGCEVRRKNQNGVWV